MTQSESASNDNGVILTGIFCGVGVVFVVVFIVLQCVCCKKPNSRSNGLVKESNEKRVQLQAVSSLNSLNGIYETDYVNETCFNGSPVRSIHQHNANPVLSNGTAKNYRFLQNNNCSPIGQISTNRVSCSLHRALPAPPTAIGLKSGACSIPTSYCNNENQDRGAVTDNIGTLTRESSTSELYATVDKNQIRRDSVDLIDADDVIFRQNGVANRNCNFLNHSVVDNGQHLVNNGVKQPVINRQTVPSTSINASRLNGHLYAKICDDHHVYSKIWYSSSNNQEPNADTYDNLTTADDSDFDPFYSRVNEEPSLVTSGQRQQIPLIGQPRPPFKRFPPHQYEYPRFTPKDGARSSSPKTSSVSTDPFYSKVGSEDPYSSIKSEEHYSKVDREDSLSVEGDSVDAQVQRNLASRRNNPEYDDCSWYAVPGPSGVQRRTPIYRRRSDGDEYAMVRKGSSALYSTPAPRKQPPPIPNKRSEHVTNDNDVGQQEERKESADLSASAAAAGNSKKEPSYRYITVRESLDALRERMDQQHQYRRPLVTNSSAVYAAISDPSLHYYSTISEHSYEVVPNVGAVNNRQPVNQNLDDTEYIDQDDVIPSSSRADVTLTPDLNRTIQSDESLTVKGSHVTLVQIDAVFSGSSNNKRLSRDKLDTVRPNSVPPSVPSPTLCNSSVVTSSNVSCIPKFSDNRDYCRSCSSDNQPTTLSRFVAHQRLPSQQSSSNRQQQFVTSRPFAEPEYPTTLCFCHAPKVNSKKAPSNDVKHNVKKKSPDYKKESRF